MAGAVLALPAVFLPGFLVLIAALPFRDRFRRMADAQSPMQGANAAVVGIPAAALHAPVFTRAIGGLQDFALAVACPVLLAAWKAPPWLAGAIAASAGAALGPSG